MAIKITVDMDNNKVASVVMVVKVAMAVKEDMVVKVLTDRSRTGRKAKVKLNLVVTGSAPTAIHKVVNKAMEVVSKDSAKAVDMVVKASTMTMISAVG